MTDDGTRHLSFGNLDLVWESGHVLEVPVVGEPWCSIRLEPRVQQMVLTTPYAAPEPNVAWMQNLTFQPVVDGANEIAEFTVDVPDGGVRGTYAFVTTIADELQLRGHSLATSVSRALKRHGHVLAARSALTPEAEVGLFGELLVLRHLASALTPAEAVAMWQGPFREQHDFTLHGVDLEVKTTTSEARSHRIHGLGQLTPVGDRPLRLVSIQITRSQSSDGDTLTSLVSHLRSELGKASGELDERLVAGGWDDADADLYATAWMLRNTPRTYAVDDLFPALTAQRVQGLPNITLVSEVSYRVDVTSLPHSALPGPLGTFVEPKEHQISC